MGTTDRRAWLRARTATLCTLTITATLAVALGSATPASAAPPPGLSPIAQRDASHVTADALPTPQINGVVWSQVIVGDTVYAAGNFTNARPAGSPAGSNTVTRSNLLSFNIRTGQLTSFAPTFNGQILSVVASPNGQRIYVGGEFTRVNNQVRNRIAAFNTSDGSLVGTFAPNLNSRVRTVFATNTTVYAGGTFTTATGVSRARAAAFTASNGAVTTWNPGANENVYSIVQTTDASKIVMAGRFTQVGDQDGYGMAAVDPVTGARVPWAAVDLIRNAGPNSAMTYLAVDGDQVYGVGYHFGEGGNLEGTFSADQTTGAITWIQDCHGDTYGVAPVGDYVYTAGHAHYCGNVGGFPETNPRSWQRALSFTKEVTGTIGREPYGYFNFEGNPSPSMVNWFPQFNSGTFTGMSQGPWTVSATDEYVVMGGEFTTVNGSAQQGLVRFAVPSIAPDDQGPRLSGSNYVPSAVSLAAGTVRVGFPANWDRDDKTLSYRVIRNGNTANPVYTTTADSTYWNRPALGFTDTGLTPGVTYTYRLQAIDPDGNTVTGNNISVTVSAEGEVSEYAESVLGDGAEHFWRLGESSGSVGYDWAGFEDLTVGAGVTRGANGAIGGDSNAASTFDGTSSSRTVNPVPVVGPNTFSIESWIKTTATNGGKIVSFGDSATGESGNYDRHIYMNPDGRVTFGVYNNASYTITSPNALNDDTWHHIVGVMGPSGMTMYVDGKRVGTNGGTSVAQPYTGYWRIGGDSPWSGQAYFPGSIDDVAIYPGQLTRDQVQEHYTLSGRELPPGVAAPSDAYGAAVYSDEPDIFYRLDETSGSVVADASGNGNQGDYAGGVSVGESSPVTTIGRSTRFDGNGGTLASRTQVQGPSVFSEELWFKTTSDRGGKLIGFGNTRSGNSSNYDRHIYMRDSGQLTFGVWTGQENTITSPAAYNDGQWHHMVATQGPGGMRLYVDKQLVGTHPQTNQQAYAGFWRIGGDTTWGGASSAYFNGTIDEVAAYSKVLSPARVEAHFDAAPVTDVNDAPVAVIATPVVDALQVSLDGSGSTDADGDSLTYAWDFGDDTTAAGATVEHTYGSPGIRTVTLTVTDPEGLSDSATVQVEATAVNQPPTADFTVETADLAATFDGSSSSDPEGGQLAYAWDFGDGTTGSGVSPEHVYDVGGTFQVTLTVTDGGGKSDSETRPVTVTPPNQAPTAAFNATTAGLSVQVNGNGSTDADGSITTYAWEFGDGATASGPIASHAYDAAGTYTVRLTVTDNDDATGTTTRNVEVSSVTVLASDAFGRTSASGWGNADLGGAWTYAGGASNFSVAGGEGSLRLAAAGSGPTAILTGAGVEDVDTSVDVTLSSVPTGGGTFVALAARRQGTNDYRTQVKFTPTGTTIQLIELRNNSEANLGSVAVPGVTYQSGQTYRIRLVVTGSATPQLQAKVWRVGTTEPAEWQITRSDTSAPITGPGGLALKGYLSGSSTVAPVSIRFDNLEARLP